MQVCEQEGSLQGEYFHWVLFLLSCYATSQIFSFTFCKWSVTEAFEEGQRILHAIQQHHHFATCFCELLLLLCCGLLSPTKILSLSERIIVWPVHSGKPKQSAFAAATFKQLTLIYSQKASSRLFSRSSSSFLPIVYTWTNIRITTTITTKISRAQNLFGQRQKPGAKISSAMCQQLVWAFSCGHTSAEFKKNWCPLAVQSGIACQPMAVVQRSTAARCTSCQGKNWWARNIILRAVRNRCGRIMDLEGAMMVRMIV